jgi:hypothetical protein
VSEIEERPRSTRERKLIEYPVTRPRSRSESPFSRRSSRIVAPIPASCAPASRWRLAGATGAVGARTAVTRAFYHTERRFARPHDRKRIARDREVESWDIEASDPALAVRAEFRKPRCAVQRQRSSL